MHHVDVCMWLQKCAAYLGAGLSAVHDRVAAVEGERILQLGQALLCELVTRVNHPTVRLRKEWSCFSLMQM